MVGESVNLSTGSKRVHESDIESSWLNACADGLTASMFASVITGTHRIDRLFEAPVRQVIDPCSMSNESASVMENIMDDSLSVKRNVRRG